MRPAFPGLDPWLEHPDVWGDLHSTLITAMSDALNPQVVPRYVVRVESRTTILTALDVEETYLTVQELPVRKLVTVIEVHSLTNKNTNDARKEYLEKRLNFIRSGVNFGEIDLLRGGEPMPLRNAPPKCDYRILVCRPRKGRNADLYGFAYRDAIPDVPIPLLPEDPEPLLQLNDVLHEVAGKAPYNLTIDYSRAPQPPLRAEDETWADGILGRLPNKAADTQS
jgi:hypothetical protein